MFGLDGNELDMFLTECGFEPASLLRDFDRFVLSTKAGRRRFEAAKIALSRPKPAARVAHLVGARKQQIFDDVKRAMATSGSMTIAARKIESVNDLDRFLEACLDLGIIDENGDMKD
ncbi:hypothetical protein AB8B21_30810 [Tardiphaga sp. 866_E4_N2_1]|uniref:hypothetical protein n=1 Tax=unclassified Tardiphaga TaxID=2631404 RepID=UPI003F24AA1E